MTSSPHGPYTQGYTRVTMASTKGSKAVKWSKSRKSSSKLGLKSATRLHEPEIASNRISERYGEYVPGPCTHRPSHHESRPHPKLSQPTEQEADNEGEEGDWGEVVTRQQYENVRLDHLLSREMKCQTRSITCLIRCAKKEYPSNSGSKKSYVIYS